MLGCVYMIRNKVNEKVYVGQTKNGIEQRVKRHFGDAIHKNLKTDLSIDIRKYEIDDFEAKELFVYESENLEELRNKLSEKEGYYIDYYDSHFSGYNKNKHGSGGNGNGKPKGKHKRKVKQYDRYGVFMKEFDSITDCAISLNVTSSFVNNCVNKRKPYVKGFIIIDSKEILDMSKYKDKKVLIMSDRLDVKNIIHKL